MIILELPFPPSVNHYKIVGAVQKTKTGKIYQKRINSQETMRYYYEVWMKVHKMMAKEGIKPFDDATISLEVQVDLYPPDNRRRDVDNSLKVLLDSLVRANLIVDDSKIARLLVQRMNIITSGKVVVRIQEWERPYAHNRS